MALARAEILSILRRAPLFGGLSDAALERVLDGSTVQETPSGHTVVEEGAQARDLFVVLRGALLVQKAGARLRRLGRGDCAGEMSLIDIQPRSASLVTDGPTTLLGMPYEALGRLAQADMPTYTLLMLNAAREISRRLRRASEALAAQGEAEEIP